ncbi:hypothetical protein RP726_08180 [Candidatus Methylospira mobilis]|uniref:hypothetical protein n=1 Tax=Candidatus Methylospira mobilis TaxID=1808979 RepID=UPI001293C4D7|nr:hypothetical protein [Candidatus Methylospira mobilis]WNV06372.1 hypothetical protein RP726_08180 [Candidatus Methylospira mobilis]
MGNRHCAACKQIFQPRPQSPRQSYCSSPGCQRQRKGLWHKNSLKTDPAYRDNQKRAQQAWKKRHPGYDRQYRKDNPEYAERNRTLQELYKGSGVGEKAAPLQKWTHQSHSIRWLRGFIGLVESQIRR